MLLPRGAAAAAAARISAVETGVFMMDVDGVDVAVGLNESGCVVAERVLDEYRCAETVAVGGIGTTDSERGVWLCSRLYMLEQTCHDMVLAIAVLILGGPAMALRSRCHQWRRRQMDPGTHLCQVQLGSAHATRKCVAAIRRLCSGVHGEQGPATVEPALSKQLGSAHGEDLQRCKVWSMRTHGELQIHAQLSLRSNLPGRHGLGGFTCQYSVLTPYKKY